MRTVNVHEAKTQVSRLIDAAHAGETILVAKDGKPWARLVPLETEQPQRQPGLLRGQWQLPPPRRAARPAALLMTPALLLDTHALLWWLAKPEKLSSLAPAAINDPAATVFVSAATSWELATKGRLGQLPDAEKLLQDLPSLLRHQGFQPLAVKLHHGAHAVELTSLKNPPTQMLERSARQAIVRKRRPVVFIAFRQQARRFLCTSHGEAGQSRRLLLLKLLSPTAVFCNNMDISYVDPPKSLNSWS